MSPSSHSYPVTWHHWLLFIFALLLSNLCPSAKCESQPDGVSNAHHIAGPSFGYSAYANAVTDGMVFHHFLKIPPIPIDTGFSETYVQLLGEFVWAKLVKTTELYTFVI